MVAQGGHMWLHWGGHVWFYLGGLCGFIQRGACVVLFGGCAWFYLGVCMVLFEGACMVLFEGGMHGFIQGGHAWFYQAGGGMHGFFSFSRYNEIRSMSGRYASYWNAFLFRHALKYLHGTSMPTLKVLHTHCKTMALLKVESIFVIDGRRLSASQRVSPALRLR